ncbi:MAG: PhnD/SsuA/transferrin family substrate-binding protein, partial [Planctomycetes bacterium]|nr:PhnD/SsuA/transferrin family substrate-binding protein [Planctomycetota bacterium]
GSGRRARGRIGVWVLAALALVAAVALGCLYVVGQDDPVEIRLDVADAAPAAPPQPVLRFAVSPVLSVDRASELFGGLTRVLAARLRHPVILVQRKTYAEVTQLLAEGNLHAAIMCPGAYVRARTAGVQVNAVAYPALTGGDGFFAAVVVARAAPFRALEDLRGRRFAYSDPLSLMGHDCVVTDLRRRGEDPQTFFGSTLFTYSHDGSLLAVLDGIADGAVVSGPILAREEREHSAIADGVRAIGRLGPFPTPPVVTTPRLSPALAAALADAFLTLHESEAGRAALAAIGVERYLAPAPAAFDRLAEALGLPAAPR